jgi:hypothetical protein
MIDGELTEFLLTSTVPLADSGMEKFPEGNVYGRIVRMPCRAWACNMARAMSIAYGSRIEVYDQGAGGELVWAGGGPPSAGNRDSAARGKWEGTR